MSRVIFLLYGVVAYVIFLAAFLYAIGFTGNLIVPKNIDSGGNLSFWPALLINALLLGLFALQHSIMARPWFKTAWTKLVPKPIERSTFVLLSSLILLLLYWQWQPITTSIWHIESPAGTFVMTVLFWAGWALVLLATFMIDHFDLFGLRQVALHFQGKEYTFPSMKRSALYKRLRHPIMAGFIIAFFATPHMTAGHLFFAVLSTAYILVGIALEERDLMRFHGKSYADYRNEVRMFLPFPRKKRQESAPGSVTEETA